MTLAQRVKKILNRAEETKYISQIIVDGAATGNINFNSTIVNQNDWFNAIPQLQQGTGTLEGKSYVRNGKEVTPTKITNHWNFRFSQTDANTRDIFVVLYLVQPLFQKAYSNQTSVSGTMGKPAQFLKNGTNTGTYDAQQGFGGIYIDSERPIEKDSFKLLHKKIIHLTSASGDANGAGVVGQYDGHGLGMYSVGTNAKSHRWSFKSLPKSLKYDETTGVTTPNNFAPYWACGYYYADGTAPDTAGGILNVTHWCEMWYKDD